jgi:endonuclease YncB( thermonuclease family)
MSLLNQLEMNRNRESNELHLISPNLLIATASSDSSNVWLERDQVERILDANTVKLKKKGIVRLAGVRMPSSSQNFQLPECFSNSPSYKLRQLLPPSTVVQIEIRSPTTASNKDKPLQVVIVRSEDSLVVNEELVRTGFAKVIKQSTKNIDSTLSSSASLLDMDRLRSLQRNAESRGIGIFSTCDAKSESISKMPVVDAVFEPIEQTVETVWTADGGKQRLRQKASETSVRPDNPGDVKGCSDFKTYEDALQWYEKYEPFYGDVARLDRDGDKVPCPGLPHTTDRDRYRMKVPKR